MQNYITRQLVEQMREVQTEATYRLTEICMQNAPDLIGRPCQLPFFQPSEEILAAWIRHVTLCEPIPCIF